MDAVEEEESPPDSARDCRLFVLSCLLQSSELETHPRNQTHPHRSQEVDQLLTCLGNSPLFPIPERPPRKKTRSHRKALTANERMARVRCPAGSATPSPPDFLSRAADQRPTRTPQLLLVEACLVIGTRGGFSVISLRVSWSSSRFLNLAGLAGLQAF